MKFGSKIICFLFLVIPAAVQVTGQDTSIQIKAIPNALAVSGQIFPLVVSGVRTRIIPTAAGEKFEVLITQEGVTRPALVQGAFPMVSVAPPQGESTAERSNELAAAAQSLTASDSVVMFTIPAGMHQGAATATVLYRGKRSNEFQFTIVARPPAPRIDVPEGYSTLSGRPPTRIPADVLEKSRAAVRLERGKEASIIVQPMMDPEVTDATLLLTFSQGALQREVQARIITHEKVESGKDVIFFSPLRYEVLVDVPADLVVGPAEIQSRWSVDGQTSEPGKISIQIVDSSASANTGDAAPRIFNITPDRIGIGQAVQLAVNDTQRLQPNPEKVLVIIEQEGRQVRLKPEMNTATHGAGLRSGPVMLAVRVGKDIVGKATLRIMHPSRGEAGLSEPASIEIAGEVLAPEVKGVGEAGSADIALLSAMREQVLKSGRSQFAEYDPRYRYVTIRASGLDYNPNHLRIVFQQGGRSFPLKPEDFSLTMPDRQVVRLPDEIKPGEVLVTIQNIGIEQVSAEVVKSFVVSKPSRN